MQKKNTTTVITPKKGERYIRMAPEIVRERQKQQEAKQEDIDPAWVRLAAAVAEIVTNGATPVCLYNPVIDFLSSNSSDLWGKLMITPPMIVKILVAAAIKEERPEVSHATN